jgi:hypothetical protein
MDIFIREAASLNLTAEDGTQRGACSIRTGGKEWGPYQLTQTRLQATIPAHGAVTALLYPRLKTEPAPKVTWQSDGQVVEVETAGGKDCIFIAASPRQEGAAGGLAPLPVGVGDPGFECATHAAVDGAMPWFKFNDSGSDIVAGDENVNASIRFPAGTVAVHPKSEAEPATVVWQSPVSGAVSVEARLHHLNPGVNKKHPEKSDGIIGEIRKGDKTLARVAALSGGPEVTMKTPEITVQKGELVRLVVMINKSEWFDMTGVDMVVRSTDGRKWTLSESLQKGGKLANDLPRGDPAAVWWACGGDEARFDPARMAQAALPELTARGGKIRFRGTVGSLQLRNDRVTLSLGAAGEIRAGKYSLVSDSAATKTFRIR